jgi:hypothetical protein
VNLLIPATSSTTVESGVMRKFPLVHKRADHGGMIATPRPDQDEPVGDSGPINSGGENVE